MHSADVDEVELPSPLLAEAQSNDCVISAVYFSTAQETAPVHPDPPTWDDRQFLECPVQLRTPANQVPPGTVRTGDVPQA